MFGNMALRAEIAAMADRIKYLESIIDDQRKEISGLYLDYGSMIQEMWLGMLINIQCDQSNTNGVKRFKQEDVIRGIINYLEIDVEKLGVSPYVGLWKMRGRQEGGE